MDRILSEDENLPRSELPATGRLEPTRKSTEEGVVLLAPVHADGSPHPMLMGIDRNTRCPCHLQHGQVRCIVQCGDATRFNRSERLFELARVRDQLIEDVANGQDGRVFGQCRLTSVDDLFDGQCHLFRQSYFDPVWPSRRLPRNGVVQAHSGPRFTTASAQPPGPTWSGPAMSGQAPPGLDAICDALGDPCRLPYHLNVPRGDESEETGI
jgi:hypothetical protein